MPVLAVPIVHACNVLLTPDTIDRGGHARGGASPGRAALSPVAFAALQDAGAAPVDSPIGSPALAVPVAHGLLLLVCDNVVDASPAAPVLVSLLMALLDHSGVAVSPAARYVEEKVRACSCLCSEARGCPCLCSEPHTCSCLCSEARLHLFESGCLGLSS